MFGRIFCFLSLFPLFVVVAAARDKPQTWFEIRSPHFLVLSNAGEKPARQVAGQFERMRMVFHTAFPNLDVDSTAPIIVLAVRDEKDFRSLEPAEYLGKGKLQLGGLFLRTQDKNYVLMRMDAQGDHPYWVIYHEYTHLLASKIGGSIPLWLDEGLAEFYQNTEIHNNEASLGEPSAGDLQLLRENRLLPLPTLFAVDHNSPYYHEENKGSIFYAQSWALTHFLVSNDYKQKTRHLPDFMTLVSQNVDPVTAATRAFGDLAQVQRALENYVSQGRFLYFKVPLSTQVDESVFQARELPEVQADAVRADFLAYNNRQADARPLLAEILQQDPNNVSARETMGLLAFRQGDMEAARKWYGEAAKLDSQSYLAHYYFASISMQNGSLSPEDETQVESSLRAAIKLGPSFAPSYDRLAAFYEMRNRNLDEAHMLALQAVQLDPTNLTYRLNLSNSLLTLGRGKDAVALIQRSMSLAKSPAEIDQLQSSLSQAQRYEEFVESQRASRAAGGPVRQPTIVATLSDDVTRGSDGDVPVLHREKQATSGPHRIVDGVIKNVRCSYPTSIDFELDTAGSALDLHSRNYLKIPFSASNFTPSGELDPCTKLEGMHAKVEYIEPSDKTEHAWIVGVELRK